MSQVKIADALKHQQACAAAIHAHCGGDPAVVGELVAVCRYLVKHAQPYGIGNALNQDYRYEVRVKSIDQITALLAKLPEPKP